MVLLVFWLNHLASWAKDYAATVKEPIETRIVQRQAFLFRHSKHFGLMKETDIDIKPSGNFCLLRTEIGNVSHFLLSKYSIFLGSRFDTKLLLEKLRENLSSMVI